MSNIFNRLDRMRKSRNVIDYGIDPFDVSEQILKQSIEDVRVFIDKVKGFIDKKDPQLKIY